MTKIDVEYKPDHSAGLDEHVKRSTATDGAPMKSLWEKGPPRLVLTSDRPLSEFDPQIIEYFKEEGFAVSYLPFQGDLKDYQRKLSSLGDELELGEKYAIVAYAQAAAVCLETCTKPMPHLAALVAYYPATFATPSTGFPPSLLVQIHLTASQLFSPKLPYHVYPDAKPGFAEHNHSSYDKISSRIAWSRALGLLRRAFNITIDLESIWEHHTALEFAEKDADKTMATMVPEPYVNHVPTMAGGIGHKDLRRFYADFFIPGNPPSMKISLLSRTVGSDRVVDEMLCEFEHTQEIPWLLPGVPPTGKKVEVVLVGVICIRGEKLYHEHLHWDQATVLVQIGLLDPGLIPKTFTTMDEKRRDELKRLPVVGVEGARKVVDETQEESNKLIPSW